MRSAVYVLSLVLSLVAQAAPVPEANAAGTLLFTHDPYSIHRRSNPPTFSKRSLQTRDDEDESMLADLEAEADLTEEISLASCSTECGVIKISGVKSEKEALCSDEGLHATKTCAKCIDTTWPDTRFQQSAMSEYQKLVALCETGSA